MCRIIIINNGEKEIQTPRQFHEHFGFMPMADDDLPYTVREMDYCLCNTDVERTFEHHKIEFSYSEMLDYVVSKPLTNNISGVNADT
jgi:hypothetical protein